MVGGIRPEGLDVKQVLLALMLGEGAETDELAEAIQWVNDTMVADLRATRLFG